MRVHVKSTRPDGHWRCGVKMTPQGGEFTVYDGAPIAGGFSIDELARLKRDFRLIVTELAENEPAPIDPEDALKARIDDVIGQLTAADFDKSGKPKLGALREALPDDTITADLRNAVWAEMEGGGFTAPTE